MKFGFEELKNGGNIINNLPNCEVGVIKDVWRKNVFPRSYFGMKYANQEIDKLDYQDAKKLNVDYNPTTNRYTFDEHGYRKYPSILKECNKTIYCFGCENTFGVGTSDEQTWPFILATLFEDVNVKNFGSIGSSSDSMIRTCYQIINLLKKSEYPDSIYFFFPDFFRTEYIGNIQERMIQKNINPLLYWSDSEIFLENNLMDEYEFHNNENSKIYTYYKHTSVINSFFNFVENFKFLEEFLREKNIKWYWYTWYKLIYQLNKKELLTFLKDNTFFIENKIKVIPQNKTMLSEDNLHFGYEYNKILAQEFYNLRKQETL